MTEISVSYEEDVTGMNQLDDSRLKVYGSNGKVYIRGAEKSATVNIYTTDGKLVHSSVIDNEHVITLPAAIYAVNINDRTFKVAL